MSHMMAKVIQVLDTDPDEYFQGGYNWYYTGGPLEVVQLDQQHFSLHIVGEQMNVLSKCHTPLAPSLIH